MNEHLETATAAHLTLSLRVITMQQHAINSLEAKCAAAVVAATELAVVSARVGALETGDRRCHWLRSLDGHGWPLSATNRPLATQVSTT